MLFSKLEANDIRTVKALKDATQGLDAREISKALEISTGMAHKVVAAVTGKKASAASEPGVKKHPQRVSMVDVSMLGDLSSLRAGLKKTNK